MRTAFDQNDIQYSETNPISYYVDDASYSVDTADYFKYRVDLDEFSYSCDDVTHKNYESMLYKVMKKNMIIM